MLYSLDCDSDNKMMLLAANRFFLNGRNTINHTLIAGGIWGFCNKKKKVKLFVTTDGMEALKVCKVRFSPHFHSKSKAISKKWL